MQSPTEIADEPSTPTEKEAEVSVQGVVPDQLNLNIDRCVWQQSQWQTYIPASAPVTPDVLTYHGKYVILTYLLQNGLFWECFNPLIHFCLYCRSC